MDEYIKKAIEEVVNTDDAETFAKMNQTAFLIAQNVLEQIKKDAITRCCEAVIEGDGVFTIGLPSKHLGDKIKVCIIEK